jgi:cation:H+ antiporter
LLFLGSLSLTLAAAALFADRLDHLGPRLGLPETIVGLLTALAADAPEISSAVVALARGEKDIGLGVVLGSNAFNLAAMIGISGLAAGAVTIRRRELTIEGVTALAATLAAGLLVAGAIPAWLALALVALLGAAYLAIVARRPAEHAGSHNEGAIWRPAALIVPAVALIVVGAVGMVHTATTLSNRWHVSHVLVGIVVLAVLTSLPNAFTAVRLALTGRGAAVVSETFGSNSINLVGGLIVPTLFVGLAARSAITGFDFGWLALMTVTALVLLARRGGVGRAEGIALILLYAVFVAVQLAYE